MKKQIKAFLLVVLFIGMTTSSWGQVTTEGNDFWVTFLRACEDSNQKGPTELKLTVSSKDTCTVFIENTQNGYTLTQKIDNENSSTEILIPKSNWNSCYSDQSEKNDYYTALHVHATATISLFAGNYRSKSFDATNVLPTATLMDEYLIQTYPPSDHDDKPQGSHFAIIAVEEGETVIDYNQTAKTEQGAIGSHSVTLKKGQVWYLWTGKNKDDEADLSGSTVKARDGKKIAVFQGCPHTNIPNHVRDRDHIFSQAMPIAYWGTEFGITASRKHRRDIIAVMAIDDGTVIYRNDQDGEKIPLHTFDFSKDKKQYWTFEIGEYLAYCADNEGQSPSHGKLPEPSVIDSSCYLTASCPVGVHLFMVSNRYDNAVERVNSDTLVSDPAMLWISPIEQVIREINFATYDTKLAKFHFMNIVTPTTNVTEMTWNGNTIARHFHPITGKPDYSFARIEIPSGNHNLKGKAGFLAHVYGYGERESYAYSAGSSAVRYGVYLGDNPTPIEKDQVVNDYLYCVNDSITYNFSNINREVTKIQVNFGDGTDTTFYTKSNIYHKYNSQGWYDAEITLTFSEEEMTQCQTTTDEIETIINFSFYVKQAQGVLHPELGRNICLTIAQQDSMKEKHGEEGFLKILEEGELARIDPDFCYEDTILIPTKYRLQTEFFDTAEVRLYRDSVEFEGQWYYSSDDEHEGKEHLENGQGCDSTVYCKFKVVSELDFAVTATFGQSCSGDTLLMPYTYSKGEFEKVWIENTKDGQTYDVYVQSLPNEPGAGEVKLLTTDMAPGIYDMILHAIDKTFEDTLDYEFQLEIRYPADIFNIKFGNTTLALYDKGYGGNKDYDIQSCQWYLNGEPIEGATDPLYSSDTPFSATDTIYVLITNSDGIKLYSCDQSPEGGSSEENQPEMVPAKKVLVNQRMYIKKGEEVYDIYGQRVN